ncbi:pantoate--beta-alanine ligase [Sulfurimonas sp.]|uniref:pantoate--beta-alanine ligase n=1 Tax=Sulfurimonas sp. TaxID=2022749 RepID=UPI0025EB2EEB|nr:pantoate--beta-alanine ligase [Sulfurimonas sp.]MBW6487706.1 pantoate--beta-alanine ligase [Sulfurimonas sp.]
MKIISTVRELKEYLKNINLSVGFQGNQSIGFVPTMGALHEGHISLIKKAKEQNDFVVVSIFLNPTQFLKGEDLDKYPKKEVADTKLCKLSGVDVLFFPDVDDIYTKDEASILAPKARGFVLEGESRPGHFNGVLTVVMKLLNIVNPTRAYFGKKDAQQLNLISLMVRDFFMDVEIVPVDTVREKDGLALSSRNAYLSKEEREEALKIATSLRNATAMVMRGVLDSKEITSKMREILSPMHIFYVEILNREFNQISHVEIGNTVILVEVRVGTTRLLDNIWL